jgi:hypothetical protein
MCGKKTRDTGGNGDCQLCMDCFELSGQENFHSDDCHDDDTADPHCGICRLIGEHKRGESHKVKQEELFCPLCCEKGE